MAKKISDFITAFDQELNTTDSPEFANVSIDGTPILELTDGSETGLHTHPAVTLGIIDNPNAYGTSQSDQFGNSVSITELYSIVGASYEDDAGGEDSGKAYIFDNNDGSLLWTLDNPNAYDTSANDSFGRSVSISESYSIVGAHSEDDADGTTSGKAYIFDNSDGSLLWTLDNPNPVGTSKSDIFGGSVSITELYSIVGASGEDDAGGEGSGKAYIFDNSDGSLLWTLDNPNAYDTSAYDSFGTSVSISESYSIVGAYQEDDADGTNSGKAYIFDNATGNLLWTLDNPNAYDTSANDYFGIKVSISESYSIVSAPNEDDAGGTTSGKAYIFDNATGNLLWTLDNPNAYDTSDSDEFGRSVSITESYSVVGAYGEDDAGGEFSGKAYIFDNATGNLLWTIDNPSAFGISQYDRFGGAVSITESSTIISAYSEGDAGGTGSGKVYTFDNSNLITPNPFNQELNTNDSVEFADVTAGTITGGEPWTIHTTTTSNEGITAVVNNKYMVDTTASTANIVITMPTADLGGTITVTDMSGNFASGGSKNVITDTITFEGSSTTFEFDVVNKTETLMFVDLTYGWKQIV